MADVSNALSEKTLTIITGLQQNEVTERQII